MMSYFQVFFLAICYQDTLEGFQLFISDGNSLHHFLYLREKIILTFGSSLSFALQARQGR
jgi:hypothetical protein